MSKDKYNTHSIRPEIKALKPYVPGLSVAEIRERYNCSQVIKMASNENPLGTSPFVQERLSKAVGSVYSYPQGGNPRLVKALADKHGVDKSRIVVGNGSDEIIDLLMRVCCVPGKHNIVCFRPCFGIYTTQAHIAGIELRQRSLNDDFSFSFSKLLKVVDKNTSIVLITTPDNPSGFCPKADKVLEFANKLPKRCLLVIDEAYMDFTDEKKYSLLAKQNDLKNVVFLRTFSKSYGLAGLRLGYGILPSMLSEYMWRTRLPFSVNILAEEAGLAALEDEVFYQKTIEVVRKGREQLSKGLKKLNCTVYESHANFIMFEPPENAHEIFEALLHQGIIIRPLKSYSLPQFLRVSVGTEQDNKTFLACIKEILA